MESLTKIQQAVLDYTRSMQRQGQPFPSLREIAANFGFKHTTARFHLKALEKKGYIQQRAQRVSDYLFVGDGFTDEIPDQLVAATNHQGSSTFELIAKIPAGAPVSVYDDSRESFSVTHDYFGGGDILSIRVSGDSMNGDSIADGDVAMIKRQQEANKGDILALRIDGEITLKRVKLDAEDAFLLPSNPDYPIRQVRARDLEILGKLVGIIRKV
ncbi:MAG: transcriptional repressor LexA [Pseudomonadota bacterium]